MARGARDIEINEPGEPTATEERVTMSLFTRVESRSAEVRRRTIPALPEADALHASLKRSARTLRANDSQHPAAQQQTSKRNKADQRLFVQDG